VLTEIIEKEAKLPKRERRSTQRLFEELRGRGHDGAHDSAHRFVKAYGATYQQASKLGVSLGAPRKKQRA
jgi:hypothetical protein